MKLFDLPRVAAYEAVRDYLDHNGTNAIAQRHVMGAVNAAMAAFEDEWTRDAETRDGWALVLDGEPLLTVPTVRMARHQRRMLARLFGVPRLRIKLLTTQYAV